MCKTEHQIETALKSLNLDVQIVNFTDNKNKRLRWDVNEWIVCERKRYARNSIIIIRTNSIKEAVEKLIGD